ncbi:MAG: hypothetical protein O3A88_04095 [Proteobacteria bacterium]|nr:hypothetical protein [Pseudomonadota bacterium]
MNRAAEILAAHYGATRLARFDAQGLRAFNPTVEGFWRSFWAAALVAPFYAILLAFHFATMADPVHPVRFALVEAVTYVIAWLAFPVAMVGVSRWLGRWDAYVGYIVAYNWAAVVQNAIYLPLAMLAVSGAIPARRRATCWASSRWSMCWCWAGSSPAPRWACRAPRPPPLSRLI